MVDRRPPRDAAWPDLLRQPELGEAGDLGGDGRARDAQPVGKLGTRQRPVVAEQGEDPGLHRALGPAGQ